jgi:endonuclease YncB( thermonuclease family)
MSEGFNIGPGNELWLYRARPIRTVDGDTIYVVVDHGMRLQSTQSIRVARVNCPELFSGDDREAGAASRDFTRFWLESAQADDWEWPLLISTHKDKQSFNRYVADVYNSSGESLAKAIIAANYGVPADG